MLHRPELGVSAAAADQLRMCPLFDHPPVPVSAEKYVPSRTTSPAVIGIQCTTATLAAASRHPTDSSCRVIQLTAVKRPLSRSR